MAIAILAGARTARGQDTGPRIVDIALREGRASGPGLIVPARGAPTLRLRQGENVALRWTSERPVELHVHGLRIETLLEPGAAAIMPVATRATGRFAVEMHDRAGRHAAVLYIEIYPR